MTQWLASNKAAIFFVLWIVGTALYRALPAEASSFKVGQFFLDWIRGILGMLPSTAPKLTDSQKASLAK